jgi:hypothetical protein
MKIGFSLPNIGPIGTVEAITEVAQRAEALGYSRSAAAQGEPLTEPTRTGLKDDYPSA